MRIILDGLQNVLDAALASDVPTYLAYYLSDEFSYWYVKPVLFKTRQLANDYVLHGYGDSYYVCEIPPHAHANLVKFYLSEHYHYQIYGDTYQKKTKDLKLIDLKLL